MPDTAGVIQRDVQAPRASAPGGNAAEGSLAGRLRLPAGQGLEDVRDFGPAKKSPRPVVIVIGFRLESVVTAQRELAIAAVPPAAFVFGFLSEFGTLQPSKTAVCRTRASHCVFGVSGWTEYL
jgi:hypothetical protein